MVNMYKNPPPDGQLKGSAVLIGVVVSAVIAGAVSLAVVKMNQNLYGSLNSASVSMQSFQYAESEAAKLRYCSYDQLSGINREEINNSDGYEREVLLSAESVTDGIYERIATINIYKKGESIPRSVLKVSRSTADLPISGVPIGTIIAWPGSTAPTENGTWLLCNGQSAAGYPKLQAIIGNTVPNLNGRFLEGTTGTPRSFKEAGLPNITGTFELWKFNNWLTGSFYTKSSPGGAYTKDGGGDPAWEIGFDASRSSQIYGASETVQPASYTVRYYIKAT